MIRFEFGFGKSSLAKMENALEETQEYLKEYDVANSLSTYQVSLVPKTKTFLSFAESYERDGLTRWGGLINYCINALNVVISAVDREENPIPIVIHIAEKMAHVVDVIEQVAPNNELNELDQELLIDAKRLVDIWLKHSMRMKLIYKVDSIILKMGEDLKEDGVLASISAGSDFFKPLTQW